MIRPDTWMPFYVGDYMRDTWQLTALEHGAYILLIMQAWTSDGALPADDDRLRRMAKMEPKEWKKSRDVILPFFHRVGDTYRHKRIDKELANAKAMIEQRSLAGRASAEARARQRTINGRSTSVGTGPPTEDPTDTGRDGQRNARPSPTPKEEREESKQPRARSFGDLAEHITICATTGKRICHGWYFDDVMVRIYEAAKINDAIWTGRTDDVVRWLADDITPNTIVAAIKRCVGRSTYHVPSNLSYFDRPVREENGRKPTGVRTLPCEGSRPRVTQ